MTTCHIATTVFFLAVGAFALWVILSSIFTAYKNL